MNKKCTKIILQHVLARSPQRAYKIFQNLNIHKAAPLPAVNDQAYLDNNLSSIFCDFLLTNQYSGAKRNSSHFMQASLKLQNMLQCSQAKQECQQFQIQTKLIQTSKRLSQFKHRTEVYQEAQELIYNMSSEQACDLKQYLMFIYRWTLNQKGRINKEIQKNCENLKNVVIQKISEVYSNTSQNRQIENQLKRLEVLARARQNSSNGNQEEAALNYELVYNNFSNNQATRMQALQYLCKNSQKNGDRKYLKNMIVNIIERSGEQNHMKYVSRAISELSQTETSSEVTQQ